MADHMLQEIQEQPDVLQRILDTEWEAVLAANREPPVLFPETFENDLGTAHDLPVSP